MSPVHRISRPVSPVKEFSIKTVRAKSRRAIREVLFPTSADWPVSLCWQRAADCRFHPLNVHAEVEIQFVKLGVGTYAIGRRIWPFRRRTLFVIQPNVPHQFQPSPQSMVEKMFVAFQPTLLKEHWLHALIPILPVSLQLTEQDATAIESCYRAIRSELATKPPYWKALMKGELTKLLILIQRAAQRKNSEPPPDDRVMKAMEYLDAHFQDAITVPGLARIVAMSPSHLAHRFKQQVRMGIRQYLLQQRIAEAKLILEQTPGVKLTALAVQLGFCNFALFNRAFHCLTGMSPSDWRRLSHP